MSVTIYFQKRRESNPPGIVFYRLPRMGGGGGLVIFQNSTELSAEAIYYKFIIYTHVCVRKNYNVYKKVYIKYITIASARRP